MNETKTANDNLTFAALMRNRPRERAQEVLLDAVDRLHGEEIDRGVIIRMVFEIFLYELSRNEDGSAIPNEIEHRENLAIALEVDARWRTLQESLAKEFPDIFAPHG